MDVTNFNASPMGEIPMFLAHKEDDVLESCVYNVTPQMAAELFAKNEENRTLQNRAVETISRAISSGQWEMNGQAIIVGCDGRLLDGQHRLSAVIDSGKTVKMLITRLTETGSAIMNTLDNGHKRTAGDSLSLEGCRNANITAAAAKVLWQYERGTIRKNESPTIKDVVNTYKQNPGLGRAVEYANTSNRYEIRILLPTSTIAALYYIFGTISEVARNRFFAELSTSEKPSSAVATLRKRLLNAREANQRGMTRAEKIGVTIKAWNAFVTGARPKILKLAKKEDFPSAIGAIGAIGAV